MPTAARLSSGLDGSLGGHNFGFMNSAVYCTFLRTAKIIGSRLIDYPYCGGSSGRGW